MKVVYDFDCSRKAKNLMTSAGVVKKQRERVYYNLYYNIIRVSVMVTARTLKVNGVYS